MCLSLAPACFSVLGVAGSSPGRTSHPKNLPTAFLTVQPLQGWPRRSIAFGHQKKKKKKFGGRGMQTRIYLSFTDFIFKNCGLLKLPSLSVCLSVCVCVCPSILSTDILSTGLCLYYVFCPLVIWSTLLKWMYLYCCLEMLCFPDRAFHGLSTPESDCSVRVYVRKQCIALLSFFSFYVFSRSPRQDLLNCVYIGNKRASDLRIDIETSTKNFGSKLEILSG